MKDIAYGTRGFSKISDQALPYRSDEDETDLMLEEGKNLFEIHISTVRAVCPGWLCLSWTLMKQAQAGAEML